MGKTMVKSSAGSKLVCERSLGIWHVTSRLILVVRDVDDNLIAKSLHNRLVQDAILATRNSGWYFPICGTVTWTFSRRIASDPGTNKPIHDSCPPYSYKNLRHHSPVHAFADISVGASVN